MNEHPQRLAKGWRVRNQLRFGSAAHAARLCGPWVRYVSSEVTDRRTLDRPALTQRSPLVSQAHVAHRSAAGEMVDVISCHW